MADVRILIRLGAFPLSVALTLAACGADNAPTNSGAPASAQTSAAAPALAPPPAPAPAPAPAPPPSRLPVPPDRNAHQPGDLAACPGINPDIRRPPGSNCLGIVPSACGADRASAFVGRGDSPATRRDLATVAGHSNIRWIRPGEAVIENLDPGRLNMMLDAAGRVAEVDCY